MALKQTVERSNTEMAEASQNVSTDSGLIHEPNELEDSLPMYGSNIPASYYNIPEEDENKEYRMSSNKLALIFNHEKFENNDKRAGTQFDKEALQNCFLKYNFTLEPLVDDMRKEEIIDKLNEVSKRNHENNDCLVIVVLTHGNVGEKLAAYDKEYSLTELLSYFTADKCPSLTGKPKIFIIQACRGKEISRPARLGTTEMDTAAVNKGIRSIPEEADMLVAFSTYKCHVAFRNPNEGSWFIQDLCKELAANGGKYDLVTLLTRVNHHVALERNLHDTKGEYKQMPVIQSTLTHKLFLRNGIGYTNESNILSLININNTIVNEKLEDISKQLQQRISTKKYLSKTQKSSTKWENLRKTVPVPDIIVPEGEYVMHLAQHLEIYLKYEGKTDDFELGYIILSLLSNWEKLEKEQQQYIYDKLIKFFVCHAKNWDFFKNLQIPESVVRNIEQGRQPRVSVSSQDGQNTLRRSSHTTRQEPFKKS